MSTMNKKRPREETDGDAVVISSEAVARTDLVSSTDSNSERNNNIKSSSGDDSAAGSSGSGEHPSSVNTNKNDVTFTNGPAFSAHLSSLTSSDPDSNEGRSGSSDSDDEQCGPPANKTSRRSIDKPAAHKKDKNNTTHKKSASKNKKKGPENGPKKPLTAYNTFFQQERKRILDSGVSVVDLYMQEVEPEAPNPKQAMAKVIAKRWNTMSMIDRIKYDLQAKTELKEYKKAVNDARQKEAASAAMKPAPGTSAGVVNGMGSAGMGNSNFMNSFATAPSPQAAASSSQVPQQQMQAPFQGNSSAPDANLEMMLLQKLLGGGSSNMNSAGPQQQQLIQQPMAPPPAARGPPPSLEEILELYMKDPYVFVDVIQSAKRQGGSAVPVSRGNSVNSAAFGQQEHPQMAAAASTPSRQQQMGPSSQRGQQQSNNPGMVSAVSKVNELAHLLDTLSAQKKTAASVASNNNNSSNNNSNGNSAVEMELLKMIMAQQPQEGQPQGQAQNARTGPSRPTEAQQQQSFLPIAPAPLQGGAATANSTTALNPSSSNNNNQELQATLQQLLGLGMFPSNN